VDLYLQARNNAFNRTTLTVPAGATVIVHFDNQDPGIPHNLAVYTSSQAATTLFKGEIISGVSQTTYTFTAPSSAGSYFFRCDVHPATMTGTFIVT
jgi:Copper binding proteins, plastocyanin/azurin family.